MLRLSVFYREPLHEVMRWPAKHITLLAAYLSREPAPEVRIEQGIAQLCALVVNAMRGKETKPAKLVDFLLYHDAFKAKETESSERYSEADRQMLASLMSIGKSKQ